MQLDRGMTSLERVGQRLGILACGRAEVVGALVPDDHRSGPAPRAGQHALEVAVLEAVIRHRLCQATIGGIERRPLWHGPRTQDIAGLKAQVVVLGAGGVLLDDVAASAPHRLTVARGRPGAE